MAREHKDAGGVTALALAAVIIYSIWAASILHTTHTHTPVSEQEQKTLAVK